MTDTPRPREDRIDHGFEASTNTAKYSNYILRISTEANRVEEFLILHCYAEC